MILLASYFLFKDIDKLVYSIVQVTVTNLTVDFYLNGYRQSIQFFIISNKYEEISQRIMNEVNRGCTVLNGKGAFSNSDVNILMVIAKKTEAGIIFRIVKEVDPRAFLSQSVVRGVYGQGFDAIKAPKAKKTRGGRNGIDNGRSLKLQYGKTVSRAPNVYAQRPQTSGD